MREVIERGQAVLVLVSEPAMSSGSAYLEDGYSTFIRAGDFHYVMTINTP
jgi:hypothetical protein